MATLISEQELWKTRDMEQAVSRSSVWTTPSRRHLLRGPKWATASQRVNQQVQVPYLVSKYEDQNLQSSVVDPWHFGMDPDPGIHASD